MRTSGLLLATPLAVALTVACGGSDGPAGPVPVPVAVAILPTDVRVAPGASHAFAAQVLAADDRSVTWSVAEADGGGVDASGLYVAPSVEGTYHVVATSRADPARSATATVVVAAPGGVYALPPGRGTTWNPGVLSDGLLGAPLGADRLPVRTTACATLQASALGDGAQDATTAINDALDACPAGQVVQLSAGTFRVDDGYVLIRRSVVLRGAGAGVTFLARTNGAQPGSDAPRAAMPVVIIGPSRWPAVDEATAQPLAADGALGAASVTVADARGFSAGQIVLVDEETRGAWAALPDRGGAPTSTRIWKGDRVVWQLHAPPEDEDDPAGPPVDGKLTGQAAGWFMRQDRPVAEVKEIASVAGNTVTFTTPLHADYRVSHVAQVVGWAEPHVQYAGLEALTVQGGDDGNVRLEAAARCWVKGVEDTGWLGEGFALNGSFRVVVRDSYVHDGAWPAPGGGGYAISLANGTSEALVENAISMNVNKVIVARASGAGSVVGYSYLDNGFINYAPGWVEVGLNGSHMVGPHRMLFEGNEAFNADSDSTHGSSFAHAFFRNHLSGRRLGGTIQGKTLTDDGNVRCAGMGYGSRWMSYVGNVLGLPGQMDGWVLANVGDAAHSQDPLHDAWGGVRAVWMLGYDPVHWDQAGDPEVLGTLVRDGNYDFLTGAVAWDTSPGFAGTLPDSLYLTAKPAFFGDLPWPWVVPEGATKLYTLPAKARFDAGKP